MNSEAAKKKKKVYIPGCGGGGGVKDLVGKIATRWFYTPNANVVIQIS